jgi:hypothetical protein
MQRLREAGATGEVDSSEPGGGSGDAGVERAKTCRRIAAHGGAVTAARHGTVYMRTIGTAGAPVTIQRHRVGYWRGAIHSGH